MCIFISIGQFITTFRRPYDLQVFQTKAIIFTLGLSPKMSSAIKEAI